MATPFEEKNKAMISSFYYVYVLLSLKDEKFYVGSTSNLTKRFMTHQKGLVDATKSRLPLKLIFYEAYLDKYDAIRREDYLKSSKGKHALRNMLKEYLAKLKTNYEG